MHILTFDIEEWFHLLEFDEVNSQRNWSQYESRIDRNIDNILRILDSSDIQASFFVLGWIAKKYPKSIRKIIDQGYEVGLHSNDHDIITSQSPEQFTDDLKRNIDALQNLTVDKIRMYRAPGFSITRETIWALPILIEHGIEIDSSIFPAPRFHGGFPGFPHAAPCWLDINGLVIKELPVNIVNFWPLKFAFSGGGYFRFLPYWMIKEFNRQSDYVMAYFHPRDFDAGQPLLKHLPLYRKIISYYGIKSSSHKLQHWLKEQQFTDIRTAVESISWSNTEVLQVNDALKVPATL